MEDKRSPSMKEQRLRRQRLNRMKKMIVAVMSFGFLAAIALCVGLTIQVVRLNQKIDAITENSILVQESGQQEDQASVLASSDAIQSRVLDESKAADQKPEPEIDQADEASESEPVGEDDQTQLDKPSEVEEDTAKKVYLTFDDGPSKENTEAILDILKEKNVKATFFVIGNDNDYAPDLYRRILDEGIPWGCIPIPISTVRSMTPWMLLRRTFSG